MLPFDFTDGRFWLHLIQFLGLGFLWLRKPGEAASEAVNQVRADLLVLQERVKHMPTSEELAELAGLVKKVETQSEAQSDAMNTMKHQLNRIEDHLLREKR